jgi:uncharacterized protein
MKRSPLAPFCHVFDLDGRPIVYDVHTNGLVEVEPVLAAVLPLYGPRTRREIVAELSPQFGALSVRAAFFAIERGRSERGLFQAQRPRLVPPPEETAAAGACDRDLQHLVLTVTERCNLRCRYCLHAADLGWVRGHGERSMPVATALAAVAYFLDRAWPNEPPVISFYGGEALLEPELISAVVAAARAHPRGAAVQFSLDSNGVLLDDRIIVLAVRERMFLQVSLDGPASEHDRHRVDAGGRPTHARIEAGLHRLLDRDPSAADRLSLMVTLAPPVDVAAVAAYFADFPPFRRHGVTRRPRLRVSRADLRGHDWPATRGEHQELAVALAAEEDRYLTAMAASKRHEAGPVAAALCEPVLIRWHHRDRSPLGPVRTPGGNCRPGRRKLHVMPDGSLHPCERTGDVMPIGNVATGIDSQRVRSLQEDFNAAVSERCAQCWAVRGCGLCFASQASAGGGGGSSTIHPEMCETYRRSREQQLRLVARAFLQPPGMRSWLEATKMM